MEVTLWKRVKSTLSPSGIEPGTPHTGAGYPVSLGSDSVRDTAATSVGEVQCVAISSHTDAGGRKAPMDVRHGGYTREHWYFATATRHRLLIFSHSRSSCERTREREVGR